MICSGKMRTSSVAEDMTRYFFIILLGITTKVEIIFYRHNRDVVKLYETFDFNDKTSRHHKLFTNQHRPLILFYGRRAMFTVFNPRVGYVEEKLYLCGRITQNKKKSMSEISKCPKCSGEYVYFVHSYYPELCPDTIATSRHGVMFSAALKYENFYGTQFHPEKSGDVGERIIANFLKL